MCIYCVAFLLNILIINMYSSFSNIGEITPDPTILSWNQRIKRWWEKKTNFRPTDHYPGPSHVFSYALRWTGGNSVIYIFSLSWGQLLNERIFPRRSRFHFRLRAHLSLEALLLLRKQNRKSWLTFPLRKCGGEPSRYIVRGGGGGRGEQNAPLRKSFNHYLRSCPI